jgi:hypothetical protein
MRKSAKLAAIVAALLAGFIGGVFAQRALGVRTGSQREKVALIAARSEDVYRQYQAADYVEAKAALLEHIRALEHADAESGHQHNSPYAVDTMISYVRLAKLEEKNDCDAKAGYMREASVRCERLRLKWGDCSEEVLRGSVDKMDSIRLR